MTKSAALGQQVTMLRGKPDCPGAAQRNGNDGASDESGAAYSLCERRVLPHGGRRADESILLGQLIGNAWHCIHAEDAAEGCGGSESCRHCMVYNTLVRAIHDHEPLTEEATVVHLEGDVVRSLNLMTHVVPAELIGIRCFIVTLVDISDTLHRRWFERLFFHDLLNKLGALENYVTLLARDLPEAFREEMTFVKESFHTVVEDIQYQKQVTEAESGELRVEWIALRPDELVLQVARLFQQSAQTRGIQLEVASPASDVTVRSDLLLLRRVLENMIKNALEASSSGDTVLAGVDLDGATPDTVILWVWNAAVIPPEVQPYIFQRDFSTKARNRGMGTYSMKLIGERGLGGHVGFETSKDTGTRFYISLPAIQKGKMEGLEA